MADTESEQTRGIFKRELQADISSSGDRTRQASWWAVEPRLGRVANGVANRVDRLKAIGNGQVSKVAATAWEVLSKKL